jgi:hypothetical protein
MHAYLPAERTAFESRLAASGHLVKDRISDTSCAASTAISSPATTCSSPSALAGANWFMTRSTRWAGLNVVVSTVREKLGGCQIITHPRGRWRDRAHIDVVGHKTEQVWNRSLLTCEVCGDPGFRTGDFPIRCRCDADRGVV